jgi:hypothetical protein
MGVKVSVGNDVEDGIVAVIVVVGVGIGVEASQPTMLLIVIIRTRDTMFLYAGIDVIFIRIFFQSP